MKNVKKVLFAVIMLFIGVQCIMAENLTNLKVNFKHYSNLSNTYQDLYMEVTADNFGENEYRVLFTKDNSSIPTVYNDPDDLVYLSLQDNVGEILNLEYVAKYGNVYVTLYEYDGTSFNKASDTILVNRPQLLAYTNRIVGQFYDDNSMDIRIKDIYSENSKVKFKVGEVTDTTLLNKLDGTNNSAYAELITYAKNDTNPILNSSVQIGTSRTGDSLGIYSDAWDPTKVAGGKYYYGYFVIDDENGTYYALEDVQLYKLQDGGLYATNFKSETTPSAEITTGDDVQQSEEVEVPNTASTYSIMIILFGIVLVGLGAIILIRTRNKINSEE